MKILVTGAAGFIGSNFVFHMLDAHPDYDIDIVFAVLDERIIKIGQGKLDKEL